MDKKERGEVASKEKDIDEIHRKLEKIENEIGNYADSEIAKALRFLKYNKLKVRFFKQCWYDCIKERFYAVEYIFSNNIGYPETTLKEWVFDEFGELYEFTDGKIYQRCCFYGYDFSEEEINKYHLDLARINFIAFYKSWTLLEREQNEKNSGQYNVLNEHKRIKRWIDKHIKEIYSYRKYLSYENKMSELVRHENYIYFYIYSLLQQDYKTTKDFVIQEFANYGKINFLFYIYFMFGLKEAEQALVSYKNKNPYLRENEKFAHIIRAIDKGEVCSVAKKYYDEGLECYRCDEKYYKHNREIATCSFCFPDKAALNKCYREEGKKIKRVPLKSMDYDCLVDKFFANDKFWVKRSWIRNGETISCELNSFKHFFDFVYYLSGDLSNAELSLCDGIEKIKRLKELNLKGAILENKFYHLKNKMSPIEFDNGATIFNQHEQGLNLDIGHERYFSYISDIDLQQRFLVQQCETDNDKNQLITQMAHELGTKTERFLFIGGNTSDDIGYYERFMSQLNKYASANSLGDLIHIFTTLGDYEISSFPNETFDEIVRKYKEILIRNRMYLLQNNLYYLEFDGISTYEKMLIFEITSEELIEISSEELQARTRRARLIVFGGIGFSGYNEKFNANNGIYNGIINRNQEMAESQKFYKLYEKVRKSLSGRNVIVMTHMPLADWNPTGAFEKGFIYISGHTHQSYYLENGESKVYADNQIGYKQRYVTLKTGSAEIIYDIFSDYSDGIYAISLNEYREFYRGYNIQIKFKLWYEKIHMLKHDGYYMFLYEDEAGHYSILSSKALRKAKVQSLEYYYDHITMYSESIKMYLKKYSQIQDSISKEIKVLGGTGFIQGCFIDIDYYNHIFINPLDGKITPFYTRNFINEILFKNVPSLLKAFCPSMYEKYKKLQKNEEFKCGLAVEDSDITDDGTSVEDASMLEKSRLLQSFKYRANNSIVITWNDEFVDEASEENGRILVMAALDPYKMCQKARSKLRKSQKESG